MAARAALLCGGQGSQSAGLGGFLEIMQSHRNISDGVVQSARRVLSSERIDQLFGGLEDPDLLQRTDYTQPLLFMHSYLIGSILEDSGAVRRLSQHDHFDQPSTGVSVGCYLGHSLGEYAALALCGSLSFEDGLQLVHRRGQVMHEIVSQRERPFAMMACIPSSQLTIQTFFQKLTALCAHVADEMSQVCEIANVNSPTQIVISGDQEAVDECVRLAKTEEWGSFLRRGIRLRVGAPFHCSLLRDSQTALQEILERVDMRSPEATFISAIKSEEVNDPLEIKDLLVEHCTQPVQWQASMEYAEKQCQVNTIIEIGLSRTLSSLAKQICSPNVNIISVGTHEELSNFLDSHLKQ